MINPGQLSVTKADGTNRNIIIEPILEKDNKGLHSTGIYKLYKDAFGEESSLFTEPLEINETGSALPDKSNPDFLGQLAIDTNSGWRFEGDLLSAEEQEQVVVYIRNYKG